MPKTRFDAPDLASVRRAYAKQMVTVAGVDHPRVEAAFAAVPREDFLGPGPWLMLGVHGASGYSAIADPDPVLAYQDVLFGLQPERKVNNGSPSLHANWLAALDPGEGAHVLHAGAGAGYYTAILAHLVGEGGHVTAVEFDSELAAIAARNLLPYDNVRLVNDDGAAWPKQDVDGIYVSFGTERPAPAWIERLKPDGRLILPLCVPAAQQAGGGGSRSDWGAGLKVTRLERGFAARCLGACRFVCAEGALAASSEEREALRSALRDGRVEEVRSLVWQGKPAPERCWFVGSDWALSYDEP